jgi:hypothetical protein
VHQRRSPRPTALSLTLAVLAAAGAAAQETLPTGPRSLAMGGTGVAVADDHTVAWQNPGALGFFGRDPIDDERVQAVAGEGDTPVSRYDNNNLGRKDWGLGVDVLAGYRIDGVLTEAVKRLADVPYQELANRTSYSEQDIKHIITVLDGLSLAQNPDNAIVAQFNAGAGLRIGHFAIGARGYSEVAGRIDGIDLVNLGLNQFGGLLADEIVGSSSPSDGTIQLFDTTQRAELINALGGDADAVLALEIIDFQARAAGLNAADATRMYEVVLNTIDPTIRNALVTGGSLEDNTTAILATGYGVAEIPISYGVALSPHWSVGLNLKYLLGRVYGSRVLVFNTDTSTILDDAQETYRQSSTFGVDVGLLGRYRWIQGGLMARNLNAPTFAGPSDAAGYRFPDVTLDPQITVGAALIPFETLAITADLELLRTDGLVPGTDHQKAAAGIEANLFRVLALRGGVSQNLAASSEPANVSGGLGLDLYLIRFDLAAACSTKIDTITWDGTDYRVPDAARVSLQLAIDF